MALDQDRAERIKSLKAQHPELTWGEIADKVGVTERSAIDWQKTGGISHPNCKKLAKVFAVDPNWLWSGVEQNTPDLLEALRGDVSQLDRIEQKLDLLLQALIPSSPAEVAEEVAARRTAGKRTAAEPDRGGNKRSRRAA